MGSNMQLKRNKCDSSLTANPGPVRFFYLFIYFYIL